MAPSRNPVQHRDERPILVLLRLLLRLPSQHTMGACHCHDHRAGVEHPYLVIDLQKGGLEQGSSSSLLSQSNKYMMVASCYSCALENIAKGTTDMKVEFILPN